MTDKTARRVSGRLRGTPSEAYVYRLSEPLHHAFEGRAFDHVVVSAVDVPGHGPETLIFPATGPGETTDVYVSMLEFDEGSLTGDLDHGKALALAGYQVVDE